MPEPVVLVTGASGQLATTIKTLSAQYQSLHFIFLTKEELPIHHFERVEAYFKNTMPAFCINCAAYTAVDKAETEKDEAMLVNGQAVGVLAGVCKLFNTKFIHISTDYVFDGTATTPYKEDNDTNPVNYYGATKLKGEELSFLHNSESVVIRTSWVYAAAGNNFVKTMMRLMKERSTLNVVNDQWGSPTYALDLASVLLHIIIKTAFDGEAWMPGIYHYSNEGSISWYDFAVAIKELTESNCVVQPVPATMYPTPAKRPAWSVMSKEKIKSVYQVVIPEWKDSLADCIKSLKQ